MTFLALLGTVEENSPKRPVVLPAALPFDSHHFIARGDVFISLLLGMIFADHRISVSDKLAPAASFRQKRQDALIKFAAIDFGAIKERFDWQDPPPLKNG